MKHELNLLKPFRLLTFTKVMTFSKFQNVVQVHHGTAKDASTKGTGWPRRRIGRSSGLATYLDLRAGISGGSSKNSHHLAMYVY